MEMLICLSYLPTLLRAIRTIQVFASLAWLETDLKVPPRDHSPSFLPWLYNTLWSLQRLFGTTTNVTDPSIGNHTCLHNALPAQLDTKVLNLISSFRCIVASVEEPSFQQSLWDISLPAQRLVDALPSVWRQKHVVCHDLVNFDPELILCHSWSGKKKKKTRSVYEVCIQIWVLLPWQGICHEIRFPRWQRKVKGKDKKKEGQEAKQREIIFIPQYSSRLGGWSSPFSVLLSHSCAVNSQS